MEQYPIVSKQLREIFGKQGKKKHDEGQSHCCGMMAMSEQGLGHKDLDELVKIPQPLSFTLGLSDNCLSLIIGDGLMDKVSASGS